MPQRRSVCSDCMSYLLSAGGLEDIEWRGFETIFSKKTFQRIFSLHFVMRTIFYAHSEECKGFVIDLI